MRLVNRLGAPTNLHVHGLHVSPQDNGDNMFVSVPPGSTFDYEYELPPDHPPGVFWYHPHLHGTVAEQIFGGLYGAIVVADPLGGAAAVPVTRDRVMVISDITLDGAGRIRSPSAMDRAMGRHGDLVLVNGRDQPVLSARTGERERWRVVNACAGRYLKLALDGHQLRLLGIDSGRFVSPRGVDVVVLAPGNRADLLLDARLGSSRLRALPYDRGSMLGTMGQGEARGDVLATLQVTGSPVPALGEVPGQPEQRDLRGAVVARRRELTFAAGMGMGMGGNGRTSPSTGRRSTPTGWTRQCASAPSRSGR